MVYMKYVDTTQCGPCHSVGLASSQYTIKLTTYDLCIGLSCLGDMLMYIFL